MNEYKPTLTIEELADKLIESNPVVKRRFEELKAQHQADKKKKDERVALRLAKQEKKRLEAEAAKEAQSLSAYIRSLITNR